MGWSLSERWGVDIGFIGLGCGYRGCEESLWWGEGVERESRRWGTSVEVFTFRCFGLSERPHRTDLTKPLNEMTQDEDEERACGCVERVYQPTVAGSNERMVPTVTHGVICGASGDTRKWLISSEIESLSALPVVRSDALAGWFHRLRDIWRGGDSDSGDELVSSWWIALPRR